uniref:Kynurenine--oxoglutarate transaminase 3 n=2 Tax=Schistocephalus solidus TaxID=70667 RepID=A0A0V0J1M4_SCHSO
MSLPAPAQRTLDQKPSLWVQLNSACAKYKPLNLGQGFPDFMANKTILKNLRTTAADDCSPFLHQYTRAAGHPRLVNALAKLLVHRCRHDPAVSGPIPANLAADTFGPERSIDPMKEIIVSVGGYGALSAVFFALLNPGEEVVIIEPAFDCYVPQIVAAGGVPVCVPLKPPKDVTADIDSSEFAVDFELLEKSINKKTKILLLNTPSNPVGKVFSVEELKKIADICIRHNLICVSDEVYEWLVFPPNKHYKIASFPGMWNRTVTIGSAGKTFQVTGWKLGWTVGPERYIAAMQIIQQNTVYTCATPLQEALAMTIEEELPLLGTEKSFFHQITQDVMRKGQKIAQALKKVGMPPIRPQAGYFLLASIANMALPASSPTSRDKRPKDVAYNEWMMLHKGLAAVPPTAFCCTKHQPLFEKYLRFCIIKDDATINKFLELLNNW